MSDAPQAIHGDVIDAVMEDDKAWFKENIRREYRIRPYVRYECNGELVAEGQQVMGFYTVVRQLEEGVRMRIFVFLPNGVSESIDNDSALSGLMP